MQCHWGHSLSPGCKEDLASSNRAAVTLSWPSLRPSGTVLAWHEVTLPRLAAIAAGSVLCVSSAPARQ